MIIINMVMEHTHILMEISNFNFFNLFIILLNFRYVGSWYDDKKQGVGTYTDTNGNEYF